MKGGSERGGRERERKYIKKVKWVGLCEREIRKERIIK